MKLTERLFYVITNKGQDVQAVEGLWEAIVVKFNLAPIIELLEHLFQMLMEQIKNYPTFLIIKEKIDEITVFLLKLTGQLSSSKDLA